MDRMNLLSITHRRVSIARGFSAYLAVFSKRLTGAARFFQEGTGPASFNSNRVDIPPGYARARLLLLHAATFIASTL